MDDERLYASNYSIYCLNKENGDILWMNERSYGNEEWITNIEKIQIVLIFKVAELPSLV